ncbi:MAG: efflux RND transporter permease subunit [Bryobacterales bacterium]|nr:efflux RND transporter permease subunit [Bryobacterales bacterium]
MKLSEICVRRPVFAFMLVLFLVVLGLQSFSQLGVDLFPRTDPAAIYVRVRLPGATPEEVVSQVVLPLEETLASINGIEEMRALVNEGTANFFITFVLERDIGDAAEDVREKVSAAMRNMPPNVLPPVVQKADPDSDPIITMAVSGNRPARELTEIADKQIRRAIETVNGVGAVDIVGGRKRQVNLFLDINKLSGYRLTAQDVERAIRDENIEAPGGRIVRGASEVGVRTLGRIDHVDEFNGIIVKNVEGSPIRVRDVGYAEDGIAEPRNFAYFKGQPAVIVEVRRQSGTNTVEIATAVKERLTRLASELPSGVTTNIVLDQSTYIKNSVKSLEEHLILGSLFASLIVWLFIRDWRTVLISAIAIPTSIIATFVVIRLLGYTLNSMTLLGLTLAVGIVIDDAIIVLENIYRWINEKGVEPMAAAIGATREIGLAVMATTLSLVIIFVPIAFMSGYARRFVNEFGWTMAVSIMVSMLVAFTLTPTLSARMFKRKDGGGKAHGHKTTWVDRAYLAILEWSLGRRWVIVGVALLTFASTFPLYQRIGRDWMPQEDQNELSVFLEMPDGSSLEATTKVTLEIAERIEKIPGVIATMPRSSLVLDRVTTAFMTILLEDRDKREDIETMASHMRKIIADYPFARPRINFPNILGGRDSFAPVRGMMLGPDLNVLAEIAKKVIADLLKTPSVVDARVAINLSNPELQVNVDRARASDLGVRVSDIAGAVRLLMSGEDQISTFKEGSEQYPVMMRLLPEQRDDPSVLSRLLVPSTRLGLIRLDSVADLERGFGPGRIDRYSRQFAIGVYGNVAQGHSLAQAAADTQAVIENAGLPPGYQLRFSGQVKVLEETTLNMILAISLASIFMYMVLAAQFESLTHPFIIMMTLPLSIPFALFSLIATGRSLNLFSALGFLLLLGIVKKNGILQIDYMNQLRAQGMPLRDAILEANRVRLRPILMTTFSIVAGLIPTAIGIGAGASQRSAIAVTIIGGQTLCLLLTLLVVPVGYSLLEEVRQWFTRREPVAEPAA